MTATATSVEAPPIRVVVVDDQCLLRDAVASALHGERGIDVVGRAEGMAEAIVLCRQVTPDVVVCDFRLADGLGSELAEQLGQNAKVLLISGVEVDRPVRAALDGVCVGFVTKSSGLESLVEAILDAAAGGHPLRVAAQAEPVSLRSQSTIVLTRRQRQILDLLARGASSGEIASELGITLNTARNHVRSVLSRLGVESRLQAVIVATQQGLVELKPQ